MTSSGWGLAQFRRTEGGRLETGVYVDGVVRERPPALPDLPVLDILQNWQHNAATLRGHDPRSTAVVTDACLAAPITYPRKLLCAGANYYGHAEEMGTARPDPTESPFFFLKPPSTTVRPHLATVSYPSQAEVGLDWEAELGVVIARTCRSVDADQALDFVAGYVAANDLSARGEFTRHQAVMAPFAFDWLMHKAQDGFCPMGPSLVPAWLVPDPQDLTISLTVNGVTKQKSSTGDMVIGIADLVAGASRIMTLEPGDVILSGTPAGVGMPRGEFLRPGDEVVVTIDIVGHLTTRIGPPAPA